MDDATPQELMLESKASTTDDNDSQNTEKWVMEQSCKNTATKTGMKCGLCFLPSFPLSFPSSLWGKAASSFGQRTQFLGGRGCSFLNSSIFIERVSFSDISALSEVLKCSLYNISILRGRECLFSGNLVER